jgi:mRNA-degrading endonuclease RelE of RelBE toxin-antitoxin system
MANRKGPVVKQVRFTRPAQKDRADLPPANLASFKGLLQEMKTGQYGTGRDLKQRQGTGKNKPKVWQARIGQGYRVTFIFKDGIATFQRIGPHHVFD